MDLKPAFTTPREMRGKRRARHTCFAFISLRPAWKKERKKGTKASHSKAASEDCFSLSELQFYCPSVSFRAFTKVPREEKEKNNKAKAVKYATTVVQEGEKGKRKLKWMRETLFSSSPANQRWRGIYGSNNNALKKRRKRRSGHANRRRERKRKRRLSSHCVKWGNEKSKQKICNAPKLFLVSSVKAWKPRQEQLGLNFTF